MRATAPTDKAGEAIDVFGAAVVIDPMKGGIGTDGGASGKDGQVGSAGAGYLVTGTGKSVAGGAGLPETIGIDPVDAAAATDKVFGLVAGVGIAVAKILCYSSNHE